MRVCDAVLDRVCVGVWELAACDLLLVRVRVGVLDGVTLEEGDGEPEELPLLEPVEEDDALEDMEGDDEDDPDAEVLVEGVRLPAAGRVLVAVPVFVRVTAGVAVCLLGVTVLVTVLEAVAEKECLEAVCVAVLLRVEVAVAVAAAVREGVGDVAASAPWGCSKARMMARRRTRRDMVSRLRDGNRVKESAGGGGGRRIGGGARGAEAQTQAGRGPLSAYTGSHPSRIQIEGALRMGARNPHWETHTRSCKIKTHTARTMWLGGARARGAVGSPARFWGPV